jgi:hypothetical protein
VVSAVWADKRHRRSSVKQCIVCQGGILWKPLTCALPLGAGIRVRLGGREQGASTARAGREQGASRDMFNSFLRVWATWILDFSLGEDGRDLGARKGFEDMFHPLGLRG